MGQETPLGSAASHGNGPTACCRHLTPWPSHTASRHAVGDWLSVPVAITELDGPINSNGMTRRGITDLTTGSPHSVGVRLVSVQSVSVGAVAGHL